MNLGATAVGTGINTDPEFGVRAIARLAEMSGRPLVQARHLGAALAAHDAMAATSAALRALAGALFKVANDGPIRKSNEEG